MNLLSKPKSTTSEFGLSGYDSTVKKMPSRADGVFFGKFLAALTLTPPLNIGSLLLLIPNEK